MAGSSTRRQYCCPVIEQPARSSAVRLWYLAVAVVTVLTVIECYSWMDTIHPDLLIARSAGRALTSVDGLHVYVTHPRAQMGPGALLLSLLPRPVYLLGFGALLGPVLLRLADAGLAISGRRMNFTAAGFAAFGAFCCVVPWSQLVWKGHADDALVLAGAAMMLPSRTGTGGRRRLIGVAVAAAGKPTAVILLALAAGWEIPLLGAAVAVFGLIWAPFVLADPAGFLSAGGGVMPVGHASLPDYLGYRTGTAPPAWIRAVQLGGGFAVAIVVVLRRRPAHALLAAFCLRALLEPNPAPAYSISVVVLAVAVDVSQRLPWATALAVMSFWLSGPVLAGGPGWYRIAALSVLLVVLLATASRPVRVDPPVQPEEWSGSESQCPRDCARTPHP
jgi:hypothetical protein